MTAWRPSYVGVVPSTMDAVRDQATHGAPEGTTVVADGQTTGRGRRGRLWVAPRGAGLWMTTLLRPPPRADLHTLSLVTGIAVLDAVHALGATNVRLKWPNDLVANLAGWRKLAGILLQADATGDRALVLVGIGVNLTSDQLPPEIAQLATSFAALGSPGVARDRLAEAVLAALQRHYLQWCTTGFAPFVGLWNQWDAFAGAVIEIDGVTGRDLGVDASGALQLQTAAGLQRLVSGEVGGISL